MANEKKKTEEWRRKRRKRDINKEGRKYIVIGREREGEERREGG